MRKENPFANEISYSEMLGCRVDMQTPVPAEIYAEVQKYLVEFDDNKHHPRTEAQGPLKMLPEVATALNGLLGDARDLGYEPYISSAFRDMEKQARYYEASIAEVMEERGCSRAEAIEEVEKLQARPGHSEHHLGTAVDVFDNRISLDLLAKLKSEGTEATFLDQMFIDAQNRYNKGLYLWLRHNAHHYGFILSYPTDVTSDDCSQSIATAEYNAEPWHLRYVGQQRATELYSEYYLYDSVFISRSSLNE